MSLSWLYRGSERNERPRRRAARLMMEQLEDRQLLSTVAVLGGVDAINTYAGVGFQLNPVGTLGVFVNGKEVTNTKSSYSVKIDWGDGTSASPDITPGELANGPVSPNGLVSPSFIIKGTHLYQTPRNTPYPIHVYVTGPNDSNNPMDAITSRAVVEKMDQPISTGTPVPTWSPQQPTAYPGVLPLAEMTLNVNGADGLSANTGSAMPLSTVGTVAGYVNGKLDLSPGDYKVQINWGDSGEWVKNGQDSQVIDTGSTESLTLEGSHTYNQPGEFPVHVYVTGPDGQTADRFTTWVIVRQRPNELSATPAPGGDVFSVTTGQELTGAVLVVHAVDPNAVVTGLKGEIHDAADGSTTSAVFVPMGQSTWDVYDTETFNDPGTNDLFINVNDVQGDTVTGSDQVVVAQASLPPQRDPQPQPQPILKPTLQTAITSEFDGLTKVNGGLTIKGALTDALKSLTLEVIQDGKVVAKGDLDAAAQKILGKAFGKDGVQLKSGTPLFDLTPAQLANVDGSAGSTVKFTLTATTNGGATSSVTTSPSSILVGHTGDFIVSHGQITFDNEIRESNGSTNSRRPQWPRGPSGVTIGPGYDEQSRPGIVKGEKETQAAYLKRLQAKIVEDLTSAGVSLTTANALAAGAGLTGTNAKQFADQHYQGKDILEITPEQQKSLFEDILYPAYVAKAKSKYDAHKGGKDKVAWDDLDAPIRDVLVDLAFRGDYTTNLEPLFQADAEKNDLAAFEKDLANRKAWNDKAAALKITQVPQRRFDQRVNFLKAALGL